jgi:hypothetical protein
MKIEELIQTYPKLYHMAERDAWPSIQKHGLLSTAALLDLFEVEPEQRCVIESEHRPAKVRIQHATRGEATIRDQTPLRPSSLRQCLVGTTEHEWYRILNSRVFFWLNAQRLTRLMKARAYRNEEHCVLVISADKLVRRYADRITLSPINSGSTIYVPPKRGLGTFLTIAEYPFAERKQKAGRDAVVELTVSYSVPDIATMCEQVLVMQAGETVAQLYP